MTWDAPLDVARANAPEVPKHRSRKDRRRWCKGKVGVEHVLGEPELNTHARYWAQQHPGEQRCRWWQLYARRGLGADRKSVPTNRWHWSCSHQRRCTVCGKILDPYLGKSCPDFVPKPEA